MKGGPPGPNGEPMGPPLGGPPPDIGPQLELLGGRKFGAGGPQLFIGGRGGPTETGVGPLGPMTQGPGVLEPEPAEGLGTKPPWGPEPGPQGTSGGGAPLPGVEGGPGEGPW